MKSLFKIIVIFTITLLYISCEKELPTDSSLSSYVGFEMNKVLDLPKNQTTSVPIKVIASEVTSSDRTFPLQVDMNTAQTNLASTFYNVPASVTIPAGSKEGVFNVSIIVNNTNLSTGRKLTIEFPRIAGLNQAANFSTPSVAGVPTVTPAQTGITLFLYEQCLNTRVNMSIKFDNYPEETAWKLFNSSNQVVDSAGFAANGTTITGHASLGFAAASTFSAFKCLAPGNYTFVIYDAFGDGLFTSAAVQGNYKIELLNGTVLVTGGGNFGASSSHTFTIN